jgi:mannose-6-phosphate isomerase-like protein (cupin superfamily)
MNENVDKSSFGYEATWAKTDNYVSKILVFENVGSGLPMHFHKTTEKSWFVNSGNFKIAWIDTGTGMLYEKEIKEGSITQTSNKDPSLDFFQLRPTPEEE